MGCAVVLCFNLQPEADCSPVRVLQKNPNYPKTPISPVDHIRTCMYLSRPEKKLETPAVILIMVIFLTTNNFYDKNYIITLTVTEHFSGIKL